MSKKKKKHQANSAASNPPNLQQTVRAAYAKGYSDAGASITKRALKGFVAKSSAPNEDIDWNNKTLRQRGRMLYMASPIAASAVNTNRTKGVGSGLHMKCAIDRDILKMSEDAAQAWSKRTEAEWRMWAEKASNCDALGLGNLYKLQQLAMKSWLMSGDVFALLKHEDATLHNPYSLRIYLIEADRISTPYKYRTVGTTDGENPDTGNRIYDGVEVDGSGCAVAYFICNAYPEQSFRPDSTDWVRVEARGKETGLPNILHVMTPERPDQYRGVTYMAPNIEMLLQQRRYTESELTSALIQSYFSAWITTETDTTDFPFNEVGVGDVDGIPSEPESLSESQNEYEMGPGTVNHLAPGETVTFGSPNIPSAGFEAFTRTINRIVGAAFELPYDVLTKEFNSSYSAAKGALEEAWEAVKMRRSWFVSDFCQPIYECWLAEAVASGRIHAPGFFTDPLIREAWVRARWDGPAQTHLDPAKEAQANAILVSHAWKTNEQVTREYYGGAWNENAEAVKHENQKMQDVNGTTNNNTIGGQNNA